MAGVPQSVSPSAVVETMRKRLSCGRAAFLLDFKEETRILMKLFFKGIIKFFPGHDGHLFEVHFDKAL
jgi:hypothetical protein